LGISEKMRAQIRGLDQASRNAQDGVSLIQTAEGAMATVNEMVIRIRELVVQAANDTNVHDDSTAIGLANSDRIRIQDEIDQLMDEIDAISQRTEFNTRTLLNGSLSDGGIRRLNDVERAAVEQFMIDMGSYIDLFDEANLALGDTRDILSDLEANRAFLQNVRNDVDRLTSDAAMTQFIVDAQAAWGRHLEAQGLTQGDPTDLDTGDAAQTEFLHTRMLSHFGIRANDPLAAGLLNNLVLPITGGLSHLSEISDIQDAVRDAMVSSRVTARSLSAFEYTGNLLAFDMIDPFVHLTTGPTETLMDFDGDHTVFTAGGFAWDNLEAALDTGWASQANIDDARANVEIHRTHVNSIHNALTTAMNTNTGLLQAGLQMADFNTMRFAFENPTDGTPLWFQIGANSNQGVSLHINSIDVSALDRASLIANADLSNRAEFTFEMLRSTVGADGARDYTRGVLRTGGEEIGNFLESIDAALAHTTAERSNLGAMQNRLEFAINNLDIASENLSAANSRVRDADMALEMMRLTQANVLQQAATSMLAQANQAPQQILQLLG
jgi:flagellin